MYTAWLAVAVPLGLWMAIGHSDITAILFGVNALSYAMIWKFWRRRAQRAP